MSQAVQRLRRAVEETRMKVLSHTDDLTFTVCGSTFNDYTIKFKDDTFSCTCMDHRRRRTFCKHIYLVYMKVLHIVPDVNQTDNRVSTGLIREAYASFRTRQTIIGPDMRESDECPICFDPLAESTNYVCRVCRNGFHQLCMDELMSRGHRVCPMCRAEIRTGEFQESDEITRAVKDLIGE
jgi:hypothetical protein